MSTTKLPSTPQSDRSASNSVSKDASPGYSSLGKSVKVSIGKASRSQTASKKLKQSKIQYQIVSFEDKPKLEMIPENRSRSISNLTNDQLEIIEERGGNRAFELNEGNAKGIFLFYHGKSYLFFDTDDQGELSEDLSAIYALRFQEAEPRSGKGRASEDEGLRTAEADEAHYAEATKDIGEPNSIGTDSDEIKVTNSTFKTSVSSNVITNTITHTGHWAKGIRKPSQIGTMGGQNAKNYILSHLAKKHDVDAEKLRKEAKEKTAAGHNEKLLISDQDDAEVNIGGRFEWLHIIGSSLGGPNVLGNMVAGTYDANTAMIPLEHRVALWGLTGYEGKSQPTDEKPLKIQGVAHVVPSTFIGKSITLSVFHGDTQLISRSYKTLDEQKLTKELYVEKQKAIEEELSHNRDMDDHEVDPSDIADDEDSQTE